MRTYLSTIRTSLYAIGYIDFFFTINCSHTRWNFNEEAARRTGKFLKEQIPISFLNGFYDRYGCTVPYLRVVEGRAYYATGKPNV